MVVVESPKASSPTIATRVTRSHRYARSTAAVSSTLADSSADSETFSAASSDIYNALSSNGVATSSVFHDWKRLFGTRPDTAIVQLVNLMIQSSGFDVDLSASDLSGGEDDVYYSVERLEQAIQAGSSEVFDLDRSLLSRSKRIKALRRNFDMFWRKWIRFSVTLTSPDSAPPSSGLRSSILSDSSHLLAYMTEFVICLSKNSLRSVRYTAVRFSRIVLEEISIMIQKSVTGDESSGQGDDLEELVDRLSKSILLNRNRDVEPKIRAEVVLCIGQLCLKLNDEFRDDFFKYLVWHAEDHDHSVRNDSVCQMAAVLQQVGADEAEELVADEISQLVLASQFDDSAVVRKSFSDRFVAALSGKNLLGDSDRSLYLFGLLEDLPPSSLCVDITYTSLFPASESDNDATLFSASNALDIISSCLASYYPIVSKVSEDDAATVFKHAVNLSRNIARGLLENERFSDLDRSRIALKLLEECVSALREPSSSDLPVDLVPAYMAGFFFPGSFPGLVRTDLRTFERNDAMAGDTSCFALPSCVSESLSIVEICSTIKRILDLEFDQFNCFAFTESSDSVACFFVGLVEFIEGMLLGRIGVEQNEGVSSSNIDSADAEQTTAARELLLDLSLKTPVSLPSWVFERAAQLTMGSYTLSGGSAPTHFTLSLRVPSLASTCQEMEQHLLRAVCDDDYETLEESRHLIRRLWAALCTSVSFQRELHDSLSNQRLEQLISVSSDDSEHCTAFICLVGSLLLLRLKRDSHIDHYLMQVLKWITQAILKPLNSDKADLSDFLGTMSDLVSVCKNPTPSETELRAAFALRLDDILAYNFLKAYEEMKNNVSWRNDIAFFARQLYGLKQLDQTIQQDCRILHVEQLPIAAWESILRVCVSDTSSEEGLSIFLSFLSLLIVYRSSGALPNKPTNSAIQHMSRLIAPKFGTSAELCQKFLHILALQLVRHHLLNPDIAQDGVHKILKEVKKLLMECITLTNYQDALISGLSAMLMDFKEEESLLMDEISSVANCILTSETSFSPFHAEELHLTISRLSAEYQENLSAVVDSCIADASLKRDRVGSVDDANEDLLFESGPSKRARR